MRRRKLCWTRPDSVRASGRPNPPAISAGVRLRGNSSKAKRIASRFGHDPIAHLLVETSGRGPRQQAARVVVAQTFDDKLGQSVEFLYGTRLADREHQREPFGRQAPANECEHANRCPVQPLRIVDQADERTVLGHVTAQHAEGGQAHEEAVRRRPLLHAEGDSEGVALWAGKVL